MEKNEIDNEKWKRCFELYAIRVDMQNDDVCDDLPFPDIASLSGVIEEMFLQSKERIE